MLSWALHGSIHPIQATPPFTFYGMKQVRTISFGLFTWHRKGIVIIIVTIIVVIIVIIIVVIIRERTRCNTYRVKSRTKSTLISGLNVSWFINLTLLPTKLQTNTNQEQRIHLFIFVFIFCSFLPQWKCPFLYQIKNKKVLFFSFFLLTSNTLYTCP